MPVIGLPVLRKALTFAHRYTVALAGSLGSFTWGVLTRAGRDRVATIYRLHRPPPPPRPTLLPVQPIAQVVPRPPAVRLLEIESVNGNVSPLELAILAQIVAQRGPRRLFEIGTFDGRTALNLAHNAPPGARVFSLDLPRERLDRTRFVLEPGERAHVDKPAPGGRLERVAHENQVVQLLGDSATFDYGPYLGTIDLVFIDGSHAYEYVRNDTSAAERLLRPAGGLLLWHDYGVFDGVTRALDERWQAGHAALRQVAGTSLALEPVGDAGAPAEPVARIGQDAPPVPGAGGDVLAALLAERRDAR